jgi:hypothetical protein
MKKIIREDKIKFNYLILGLIIVVIFVLILTRFNTPVQIGPKITIVSPQNTTYDKNNILLTVSSEKPLLWIMNSFDGGSNITECGNCNSYTRYDLVFLKGTHTIIAYASDFDNSVSKASVTFTVK